MVNVCSVVVTNLDFNLMTNKARHLAKIQGTFQPSLLSNCLLVSEKKNLKQFSRGFNVDFVLGW